MSRNLYPEDGVAFEFRGEVLEAKLTEVASSAFWLCAGVCFCGLPLSATGPTADEALATWMLGLHEMHG